MARRFYNPKDPAEVVLGNFNSALGRLRKRMAAASTTWTIVSGEENTILLSRTGQKASQEKTPIKPSPTEKMSLARHIEQIVTPSQVEALIGQGLSQEEYTNQILSLTEYINKAQKGEIVIVDPLSLIGQSTADKIEISQQRIKQMLIPLVRTNVSFKDRHTLAQQINEVLQYLGVNSVQIFRTAVEGKGSRSGLSDIEKVLLFSNCSMTMLTKLEYIDLDFCSEEQITKYIIGVTYRANDAVARDDTLEMLITTLIERDGEGTLDIEQVVGRLIDNERFSQIYDSLMETARYRGLRPELIQIFSACEETRSLCRGIQREIDLDTIDEDHPVSKWRDVDRW